MLQDKPRLGTLIENKHVENETTKDEYVKIICMKTKHVEGKAFEPLEDKSKEDEHIEVELVKDKSVEGGDVEVELVDIEGKVSEAVEGFITLESNSEINTPVFGLELEGLDLNINQPIELFSRYSNVILHDNTSRTNKYNFPLSLFILIDNNDKSQLAAQAFLSDETQKRYEWVLQQTLNATGFEPRVIMTDMNSAMDAACQVKYMNSYHVHCIWHLSQNLPKQLKVKLGSENFKEFICDFWKAQNSLSIEVFKYRFQSLLEKYSSANKYLSHPIYLTWQLWAKSFISRIFTAGMQSTSCVESINAIIHKAVASSSSMSDVVEALKLHKN
ncbi:10541_t:CDS:2 [Cetraspora pellucida]|uniref:10541_t:CDS:1 n=1 Tax=Cetraspora pellucida TaxID=1433469 RepID=A0A9N9N597_9GLOM|nr:10541_t:CDS:2 [Cetraspora pellucida]